MSGQIKLGDNTLTKIEEELEHPAVLLLCIGGNELGSDSARLEAGTFRFRHPPNEERRFIRQPILVDCLLNLFSVN